MARGTPRLTELEGTTLAIIGLKGTCTPYAIRREFLESPTPYWSGSAGAIYPLIERLEKRGLIRLADRTADGRSGKLFGLTSAGRRLLRSWLGTPVSAEVAGVPPDPLRNRIQYFALLSREEQQAFLDEAISQCREQLKELTRQEAKEREAGDRFLHLALVGSVEMMQVRLQWLGEVAGALGLASSERKNQRAR